MTSEPDRFLGLEDNESEYERSRFAVLPIPYDATASFLTGTRHGPRAIITASQQVETYDEELRGEFIASGIATLDPITPNTKGPEAMHHDIFEAANKIVTDDKFLLALGGEHSISSALVRAVKSKYDDLSVLQIDAHADLRESYQGSKYSHASVMRRIHDMGVPFVAVGIRSYSREEASYLEKERLRPVTASDCRASGDWIDHAVDRLTEHVYVTLDIDAFDPAFAPGTGTPEPGGLDWHQVTALLRAVAERKNIVAADIVEVIPVPGQVITEFLAARLAYKIISYAHSAGE
ncbi:MAG: agmatinase [Planctomycetes bacterium]|nr:agmatinase [Planctomycetota bacterium]